MTQSPSCFQICRGKNKPLIGQIFRIFSPNSNFLEDHARSPLTLTHPSSLADTRRTSDRLNFSNVSFLSEWCPTSLTDFVFKDKSRIDPLLVPQANMAMPFEIAHTSIGSHSNSVESGHKLNLQSENLSNEMLKHLILGHYLHSVAGSRAGRNK